MYADNTVIFFHHIWKRPGEYFLSSRRHVLELINTLLIARRIFFCKFSMLTRSDWQHLSYKIMPHIFFTPSTVNNKHRPRPRAWHSSPTSPLYFVTLITMRGLRVAWSCCWRFKYFGMWGSVVSVWRVVPKVSKNRDHFICSAMEKRHHGCLKRRQLTTHRQSTTSPNTWTFNRHNIAIRYICCTLQFSLSNETPPLPNTRVVSVFIVFHTRSLRPANPNLSHRNTLKVDRPEKKITSHFLIQTVVFEKSDYKYRVLLLTPYRAHPVYRRENLLHPPKHQRYLCYSQGEERNALYYNSIYK